MGSSPFHRIRGLLRILGVALVIALAVGGEIAQGHIVNASNGITHDYYTPADQARCIYGPGNCSLHSFTFISANAYQTGSYVCAEIYYPSNHSPPAGQRCDWGLARHCHGPTHEAGAEHCIDQDSTQYHVGGRKVYSGSAWIRRHGVY